MISSTKQVAAVVLAAGESRRYGNLKQLLDWYGQPFVKAVAATAVKAGLSPVIVVTGAQHSKVRRAVKDLPVKICHNPDWQQGQSTSVKVGLQAVPIDCEALIFLLADQPQIPVQLLRSLMKAHVESGAPLVAPKVEGRFTNPVLFDKMVFPDLKLITGDKGGRMLFDRYPLYLIPWPDSIITLDVDTPEDYKKLIKAEENDV